MVHEERLVDRRLRATPLSWKYPLYHGGLRLFEVGESLRRADMTFHLSEPERQFAIEQLGARASTAHVAHNGVPRDLTVRARTASAVEPAVEGIGVVLLGTFIARKGIDYSVPALDALLIERTRVRVTLLGTGRAAAEVLRHFSASVHDRIEVIETYEQGELVELLRGHQICVLASLAEGFGNSLLEGMACGLAPVATRVSGPLEFISHGNNGLLVSPRDERALQDAIRQLVDDPIRLAQMRTAATATAAEFGWDRTATRRLELYGRGLAS